MPDYKEQMIEGKAWQRACRIVIENPLGEIPQVNFVEEIITPGIGVNQHRLVGNIPYKFDNPDELITIIDPETNEPTKTAYPVGLAQLIIYSLYWKLALGRDSAIKADADAAISAPEVVATPDSAKGVI